MLMPTCCIVMRRVCVSNARGIQSMIKMTVHYVIFAAAILAAVVGCSSAATPPTVPTPSVVPAVTSSSPTPSTSPTPTPTPTPKAVPVAPPPAPATSPATTPPAAPPPAASCYPLSNEGTCYEPGEFCRKADHGASGVAGDGEKIVCE